MQTKGSAYLHFLQRHHGWCIFMGRWLARRHTLYHTTHNTQVEVLKKVVHQNTVAAAKVYNEDNSSGSTPIGSVNNIAAPCKLDRIVVQHTLLHGIPLLTIPPPPATSSSITKQPTATSTLGMVQRQSSERVYKCVG